MVKVAVIALVLVARIALVGAPAILAQDDPLKIDVEVTLVNVDVVVTDDHGRAVNGLGADDFKVYEDGVAQTITNFAPPSPDATQVRTPARRSAERAADVARGPISVAVLLDETTMEPRTRERIIGALSRFVERKLTAADRVATVSWTGRIEEELVFDSPAAAVRQLDKERGGTYKATFRMLDRHRTTDEILSAPTAEYALSLAESWARERATQLEKFSTALDGIVRGLASFPGRKVMILVTGGLEMQPGHDMFMLVSSTRPDVAAAAFATASKYDRRKLLRVAAMNANASGIALYPFSIYGLPVSDAIFTARRPGTSRFREGVERDLVQDQRRSLAMLAEETGGRAFSYSNDFTAGFNDLAFDVAHTYEIAYPTRVSDDRPVSIQVRMKDPSYRARYRRSFERPSFATTTADGVGAYLMGLEPRGTIPLRADVVRVASGPDASTRWISVRILIPASALLLDRTPASASRLRAFVRLVDDHGKMSELKAAPCDEPVRSGTIDCTFDLLVRRGATTVALGVADTLLEQAGYVILDVAP